MSIFKPVTLPPDERQLIISALAEAQGLSDCDITEQDIEDFCRATGWGGVEYD